jgi:hypothetical protein
MLNLLPFDSVPDTQYYFKRDIRNLIVAKVLIISIKKTYFAKTKNNVDLNLTCEKIVFAIY